MANYRLQYLFLKANIRYGDCSQLVRSPACTRCRLNFRCKNFLAYRWHRVQYFVVVFDLWSCVSQMLSVSLFVSRMVKDYCNVAMWCSLVLWFECDEQHRTIYAFMKYIAVSGTLWKRRGKYSIFPTLLTCATRYSVC
jgi:hypothetical protein